MMEEGSKNKVTNDAVNTSLLEPKDWKRYFPVHLLMHCVSEPGIPWILVHR